MFCAAAATLFCALAGVAASGQSMPYARTFAKSKTEVEQALKAMGANSGQKLPILDGFVASTAKPLSRYERAFYQLDLQLFPGSGTRGGTIVQVTAKITAWYADADPSKSGYEVLPSNGRLEFDLLDRLDEKLGTAPPAAAHATPAAGVSAPKAKLDLSGVPGVSQLAVNPPAGARANDELAETRGKREAAEKREHELSAELQSLEDMQKNQAHPLNLVAVKKSGTPVMARAAEGSRVLFAASAGDEFEFLDAEGPWLHVGISGVSRGYIKRGSVEYSDFVASRLISQDAAEAAAAKAPAFRAEREETSLFPGDWESLKGKKVKIYTVQPVSQVPKETDAAAKLAFAASLFENFSQDATAPVEGVVVIFDSADGGILGATLGNVQQLAEAAISKETFFKQCYMDPPEAFAPSDRH
jgi:hypothetical protein